MRFIHAAAGAAVAGALVLTATTAYAAEATLKASSTQVYQGGKVYLSAKCENASYVPVLTSTLFAAGVQIGSAGHTNFAQVSVSTTKKPGSYTIKLSCDSVTAGILGHSHGTATVSVTVLKATSSTSPSTIASSGGKALGTTTAIIETGFGGMARFVAGHHPAG